MFFVAKVLMNGFACEENVSDFQAQTCSISIFAMCFGFGHHCVSSGDSDDLGEGMRCQSHELLYPG